MALLNVVGLFLFLTSAIADTSVPALLWSPEKSMASLPDADVLDGVKPESLLNDYLRPLMTNSAESSVVFLQHKLNVDDFTKYADVYSLDSNGGVFKNIKGLMANHFSLELPQVEDPVRAIEHLKASFDGSVHTVSSASDVEKLALRPDRKFLLVVELKPTAQNTDDERAMAENDATVGAICHHLQKRNIKYTAMFTGKPAAAVNAANSLESHSGRHLLATADANNGTFMNVSGMFVYLRGVQVHIQMPDQKPVDLNFTVEADAASNSTVGNSSTLLVMSFKGPGESGVGEFAVEVTLNITRQADRWSVTRVAFSIDGPSEGTFNGTLSDTTLQTGDMDLVVPILYSYHCSNMKMYVDGIRDKSLANFQGTYVVLEGFQFQPYNVQGNAFFNAQDCVGFFTRGIWMGIFPSLILLAILIFGTLMVLNLSTPDKFDDPKGKTITIAQAED